MAIRIMDSIKTANDSTEFPVSFGNSIWLNKDKSGATENYSDLQTMYNNDELGNGGSSIQVDIMPIASEYPNEIVQYVGESGTYQNGYFYQSTSDEQNPSTYSWVQKNVQPNAESFTFNSDEFVVDSTTNEVSLKPSYADIPSFLPNNVSSSNKLATNSSITAITDLIPSNASASNKLATSADLADKQDFRIFNSLEEFNEKKGTSLTVVSGIDNMKDIANAMSNGEMLIIITKCETGSEVYFGLTTSTGWTKMFTFVKSNGLCDVECRTTFPLTLKRILNSDGVIGEWQELATTDDIFRVGDRRNTIGWADLSKDVYIDGSSNYANNVGRVEGHNAIIKVSNPSIDYQWPVTNPGDSNNFMDFGGEIQFFVDKVNNHLYVRFADSVDMSAWGEIATMDKLTPTVGYITGSLLSSVVTDSNLYYQKFGDNKLVINGWISLGSEVPNGTKIFTLPNGWKTNSNYLVPCYASNSNSAYACVIDIVTSDVKSYTPLPSGVELRFCGTIYLM